MADKSLSYHLGMVEDVLVKVDKFIFPADFLVLDMDEDEEIPIILCRPFLAREKALIDVDKEELTMWVQDESITFRVLQEAKPSTDVKACFV